MNKKEKLMQYSKKISETKAANTFSRYSLELKLTNEALKEAQELNNIEEFEYLSEHKQKIVKKLKELGFIIKEK